MSEARALFVSVKPVYAELLLSGEKTVELRRVRPHAEIGCEVLIYASSPTKELVGAARLDAVDVMDLDDLWLDFGDRTGVSREVFDDYFQGVSTGVAITLVDARRLERRVPLGELRKILRGFRPPQSFRYLGPAEVASVT
jgi:predicted transcriptional regulator